jgi:gluconokinase
VLVVIAGVAGSGKTTVGRLVAERLGCVFADGDDFHSAANVAKMRAGIPLTDQDRLPWLDAIVAWMDDCAAAGETAVVACSALRRCYREVLLASAARPRMFFLAISREADEDRLGTRTGHYFHQELLASQFDALEPPDPAEPVMVVQVSGGSEQAARQIVASLREEAQR